jgi:hypothetical protein
MTIGETVLSAFPDAHCVRIPGARGGFVILPNAGPFISLEETPVIGFSHSGPRAAWRMAARRVRKIAK